MRLRAYINHAALNLGVALEASAHIFIPPWYDHRAEEVADLAASSPLKWFAWGLGIRKERPCQAPS
jgi:hypothetical protein